MWRKKFLHLLKSNPDSLVIQPIVSLMYWKSNWWCILFNSVEWMMDHLCGLMVWVPGYRSRGPGIDSQHYHIFWEVVGLERGPLSLVSTNEELLGRNSSGSGLTIREYGCGNPLCWPYNTFYPQKTSLTSGSCSVGIVCSRTKAKEFLGWWLCITDWKEGRVNDSGAGRKNEDHCLSKVSFPSEFFGSSEIWNKYTFANLRGYHVKPYNMQHFQQKHGY
jgi:hypothetical protein